MNLRTLSMVTVIFGLVNASVSAPAAIAGSFEVPMPALFQYSPTQLGRSLSVVRPVSPFAPSLIFKKDVSFNEMGEAKLGDRCRVIASSASDNEARGYFTSQLAINPGDKIHEDAEYEMRLLSYKKDLLKMKLVSKKKSVQSLTLSCTHPSIQSWTVSEFESSIKHLARVHASSKLASMKIPSSNSNAQAEALNDLKGSSYNGMFGSGLPGTMGIQLLLGANLKAFADPTNVALMKGKRCTLMSQQDAALSDRYMKGSKFAFREYRSVNAKTTELVFDNWNHSPHQVRVECKGDMEKVKAMTIAEVEHDLNGTIQFYNK